MEHLLVDLALLQELRDTNIFEFNQHLPQAFAVSFSWRQQLEHNRLRSKLLLQFAKFLDSFINLHNTFDLLEIRRLELLLRLNFLHQIDNLLKFEQ